MPKTYQDSEKEDIIRDYMDTCFMDLGFTYIDAIKAKEETKTFNLNIVMYPSIMKVLADSVSRFSRKNDPEELTEALSCLLADLVHSGIKSYAKTAAIRTLGKIERRKS